PVAATEESVAAGKKIYAAKCASCHGANGQGGAGNDLIPAAPSLVDGDWKHGGTDGEVFTNIKNGIPPEFNMVPFKDQLKDDEIWNVVNFLRSIAKDWTCVSSCQSPFLKLRLLVLEILDSSDFPISPTCVTCIWTAVPRTDKTTDHLATGFGRTW